MDYFCLKNSLNLWERSVRKMAEKVVEMNRNGVMGGEDGD